MKNALFILNTTPHFPDYFEHPLQKSLKEEVTDFQFLDLDSHSDSFMAEYAVKSLIETQNLVLYFIVEPQQKKLPLLFTQLLGNLRKLETRFIVLLNTENPMIKAYFRTAPLLVSEEVNVQKEFILYELGMM